jgi:hypothetical protein
MGYGLGAVVVFSLLAVDLATLALLARRALVVHRRLVLDFEQLELLAGELARCPSGRSSPARVHSSEWAGSSSSAWRRSPPPIPRNSAQCFTP